MIAVAIVFDLMALIPVVGAVVGGVVGVVLFGFWFYTKGVPLISPRYFLRWLLNLVGEGVSVGLWAGMTFGVILIIAATRAEDAAGVSVLDKIPVGAKNVGTLATQAQRDAKKALRRAANPERTAQAQARLNRLRQAKESVPAQSSSSIIQDLYPPRSS